jgi:molybdate transport system ATP-binding protein
MSIEGRFAARRGDFTLDVDLAFPSRGVTALFGVSGAGKTTVLRAMAGLDQHAGSWFRVDGETWQDAQTFLPPHRRPVGYVFQEASLFDHLDVRGNVAYGQKRVPESEQGIDLERAIELLDIGSLLDRRVNTLSGGERKRVALARTLAVSPKLLLLDEPLAGLDQARKSEILPYLEALVRELDIPVVYVSHSPDEVARLSDHLVLLDSGQVLASGAISEMLTRPDLPLARGFEAEALIEAKAAGFDEHFSLNSLSFAGGMFTVPGERLPLDTPVRLRVAARDVSLTLDAQRDTSILNVFPAKVESVSPAGVAQTVIRLDVGGVPMLAHVTRKSVEALGLIPGKPVYAQIKSVAVLS